MIHILNRFNDAPLYIYSEFFTLVDHIGSARLFSKLQQNISEIINMTVERN